MNDGSEAHVASSQAVNAARGEATMDLGIVPTPDYLGRRVRPPEDNRLIRPTKVPGSHSTPVSCATSPGHAFSDRVVARRESSLRAQAR